MPGLERDAPRAAPKNPMTNEISMVRMSGTTNPPGNPMSPARRLKLVRSKAEALPFEDQSFDSSLAVCSLHHLEDPVKGLNEMERVTSGRIIVTDWDVGSAGSHNPHSPEHLGRTKSAILSHAGKNGYEVKEMGKWYLVYR